VYLGVAALAIGISFASYGFVPLHSPNYEFIPGAVVSVPLNGTNGFVTPDQAPFIARGMFSSGVNPDNVACIPSTAGYTCYGEQINSSRPLLTYTSSSAKEYGIAIGIVGIASFYLGYRYEPLMIKKRELRSIRFRVDEDICIANGVCVELAPKVFQLRRQTTPSILAPLAYVVDPSGAPNDEILLAAQMCPTGAIIIEDAETGERIHPPFPS
jgi:ferredoxin